MAKTPGSTLDFSKQRISALMQEYHRYVDSSRFIRMPDVFAHIVNCPCPRFWVSNDRAVVVINAMLKGETFPKMRPCKKEMFLEILARVLAMRKRFPARSLYHIVADVVAQPAPKFYLSPSSAKIMFYKAKKQWYTEKNLRLRFS